MARLHRKRRKKKRTRGKIGASPGLVEAPPDAVATQLHFMRYDAERFEEGDALPAAEAPEGVVTWIDVVGLADAARITAVGERFGLHPLALEDVVHVHQRPKVEQYGDHLFLVARMLSFNTQVTHGMVETEQVSLFLGPGYVVTFQERPGDCFEGVRARIREGRTRMRTSGAPYLAYALLDALIDAAFPVIERLGDRLEELEDQVFADPAEDTLKAVHDVKRELVLVRRVAWPLREMTSGLSRGDHPIIGEELTPFLRDCYDHAIQIVDLVETHREHAASLLDVYLSSLGNRQNEVMKVLTMMASIFIPLSFLVGLYGMNFDTASPWNMPELGFRYGYPILVGVMVALVAAMLVYFRRRRWL